MNQFFLKSQKLGSIKLFFFFFLSIQEQYEDEGKEIFQTFKKIHFYYDL